MAATLPKTNQPRWFFGISFTDPNSATPRVWNDFTTVFRSVSSITRGQNYELGQSMSGQPTFILRDPSEILNENNPSGPFAGLIKPYRPCLWMGTWPQVSGNLLNANAWGVPFDPGFENTTVGTRPSWITPVGGTAPVVGTATPHSGTRDLTWTTVAGATVQGVTWSAYTMPGTQYTVSVYLRQSTASTQNLVVVGLGGLATVTTGAYFRLFKTFTAVDYQTVFQVQTSGTALAGTVIVDDVQLEEGAAASTWTPTGPVVYPLFNGLVERFTRTWDANGYLGTAGLECVDNLAALNAIDLDSEYVEAVQALAPDWYYPLDDAQGNVYLDISGHGRAPLIPAVAKSGAGDGLQPGTGMSIPGDPGGGGVLFPTLGTNGATILVVGQAVQSASITPPFLIPPTIGTSWAVTEAVWVRGGTGGAGAGWVSTTFGPSNANVFGGGLQNFSSPISLSVGGLFGVSCELDVAVNGPIQSVFTGATGFQLNADPNAHLLVGVITQVSGGNTVAKIYIDGVLKSTATVTTASLGGMLFSPATYMCLGGDFDRTGSIGGPLSNVAVAHYAGWFRELSAGEVTSLWTAGGTGFAGELSGARVKRHLALGGYLGPSRVSPGSSVMGPPSYIDSIKLLADVQNTAVAEGGAVWAAPDGAIVWEGRQDRWLRLTPEVVFGENTAGGEVPYDGDFSTSLDPQYVYADVEITQSDGTTATGGKTADREFAAANFGQPYSATVDLQNPADVQSLADWTFYTHNRPLTRAQVVSIEPAAGVGNTPPGAGVVDTWAIALGTEIGTRVRVRRRATAANAAAGLTLVWDFFVEQVTYDMVDADTGDFAARFLMSPIGSATSGFGVTLQPWILGDSTYGVLGSTTVLGW